MQIFVASVFPAPDSPETRIARERRAVPARPASPAALRRVRHREDVRLELEERVLAQVVLLGLLVGVQVEPAERVDRDADLPAQRVRQAVLEAHREVGDHRLGRQRREVDHVVDADRVVVGERHRGPPENLVAERKIASLPRQRALPVAADRPHASCQLERYRERKEAVAAAVLRFSWSRRRPRLRSPRAVRWR